MQAEDVSRWPRVVRTCGRPTGWVVIWVLSAAGLGGADRVWDGGGADGYWRTDANWVSDVRPVAGDSLFFAGDAQLSNTNDFVPGTAFGGLTFRSPAGAFTLHGNRLTLNGGLTNEQALVTQTVALPLTWTGLTPIWVAEQGTLALTGPVDGAGGGLLKLGNGVLTLSAVNAFGGPVVVREGLVSIAADGSLGAVPGAYWADALVLDGGGLRVTSSMVLSSNRGVRLGPTAGLGYGRIETASGVTLSYAGTLAESGGTGGLIKGGFGTLTLSGAHTYTGPTAVRVGTLVLDFAGPGAPSTNLLHPATSLVLGGETAGFGAVNYAALVVNGAPQRTNEQSFHGTHVTFGAAVVRVTNQVNNQVFVHLGPLTQDPGGVLTVISPALAGAGHVTTTRTNLHGLLGSWATMGDGTVLFNLAIATNYARVDEAGRLVNFTDYRVYATGERLRDFATRETNLMVDNNSSGDVVVDVPNAGTLTEVNTIHYRRNTAASVRIGAGNTLRLGRYGGFLKSDTTSGLTLVIGEGGAAGTQDVGTLTAGDGDNSPGEIVFHLNSTSQSAGTLAVDARITDNGTGAVTVVKMGPGSMKLRGHNTYSGGTFLLQGRVQMVGGEVGTGNADGCGTGPIYILPGCYLFPSGAGPGVPVTNAVYIAGNGTVGEPLGAIRTSAGWLFNGPWTLLGDTTIGGNGGASGAIAARLSGPYSLTLCSPATVTGTVCLSNPSNDWTGTTILTARLSGGTPPLYNTFLSGNHEIIPNGFGRGNVVMAGGVNRFITWNLNGYSETINGLLNTGPGESCIILNNGAAPSTLTVGDNDQSATFGGLIQDGSGQLSLVKIGAGVQTLTGVCTYSGETVVREGTLALAGSGSIANTALLTVEAGAAFDVSGVTGGFTHPGPIAVRGGTLVLRSTVSPGISRLHLENARLRLLTLSGTPSLEVGTLETGGASNAVDVVSLGAVSGYPVVLPVLRYGGAIGGAGFNFVLGRLPGAGTTGYLSNDVAGATVYLVLLSGPRPLTWTGAAGSDWDVGRTTNWLAFGTTPAVYQDADSVRFDDTASETTVRLTTALAPGAIVVQNTTRDYLFIGPGRLTGLTELFKDGSGRLVLANEGINDYAGGTTVAAGTLQIGNNDATGNLPPGPVANNGLLVFHRSDDLAVSSTVSGTGGLLKRGAGVLTLSGPNTFDGEVTVAEGTLRVGSATALGSGMAGTRVEAGATLDVNGQNLGSEPVLVAGSGAGDQGAIINSGPDQINALQNVTLTGPTVFGGTGRWDIRGAGSQLSTMGAAYDLVKRGPNQVSLVGTTVDPALRHVTVERGVFSIETTTTGLGSPSGTLSIASGATLQLWNLQTPLDKVVVLQGDGVSPSLNCGAGTLNAIAGPVTLQGDCVINTAGGTTLTLAGAVGGPGALIKTGGGTQLLTGTSSYAGPTRVLGGTLVVDASKTGTGTVEVGAGAALAGVGSIAGPVTVAGGRVAPGNSSQPQAALIVGGLQLDNATLDFDLAGDPQGMNDRVVVNGAVVLNGLTTIRVNPIPWLETGAEYTVIQYSGPLTGGTNQLQVVAPSGYRFSVVDPATTPGAIRLRVDFAVANLYWRGGATGAPNVWDADLTPNWLRFGQIGRFAQGDFVNFDDQSSHREVELRGDLEVSGMVFNNFVQPYRLVGPGRLTGPGGLEINGAGLVLANLGSNDFTGPITINSGFLQVGDGGSGGSLGSGPITNYAQLTFARSGVLRVNNPIRGFGVITLEGPGTVELAGANNLFSGEVRVQRGTLRTLSSTALGDANAGTFVAEGATLDLGANNVNLGLEPVTVSGAGGDGQGAIINSSGDPAFVGPNLRYVTLAGDTTFGGTGRWDLRSEPATAANAWLLTGGQPFKLTKRGTNMVALVGVQTDPALAEIEVQEGTLAVERWTTLGDETRPLTVFSNAVLQFYQVSNVLTKPVVLRDGARINNASGTNAYGGPVQLLGSNTVVAGGTWLAFTNVLSGPGSLVKEGGSTLYLLAVNTYTGATRVRAGTLALVGEASLTGSSSLVISTGATLSVVGRSDASLTLQPGQLLAGSGTLDGQLIAAGTARVAPGEDGIGTLTISGSALLSGVTEIEVDGGEGRADQVRTVQGGLSFGGRLVISLRNGPPAGGSSFPVFVSGNGQFTGNFAEVILPELPPGLSWDTSRLTTEGILAVVGMAQPPRIEQVIRTPDGLILQGSGGTPGGTFRVLSSPDVTLPLAQWQVIDTGRFDGQGFFEVRLPISTEPGARFYRLQVP
ncbi:autotransporter-associated beta strand repeat-containing protein [Limisphaera sp. VF-2]|uniref:autotransporter-associated beta strand repeat-containing protein n=1 Tax=Limisphaera sp. VF-2 TaxID=3400418 RepID=UPI003C22D0B7